MAKKKKYKYKIGSLVIGKKADGSPDRKYVYGKTVAEKNEKLAELRRRYKSGLHLGDMTVAEWSTRWLAVYKANATPKQKKHYKAKVNNDILPHIGTMRMSDVRLSHLQELINRYDGQRKGTVLKIKAAIKQLFADAEIEGIIERNPSAKLGLPETTEIPRRPLTVIERTAFLKVADTHDHGAYFLMMLYCGLRRGECLALTVSDIDLDNKRLTVAHSLQFDGNVGELTGTKSSKLRKKDDDGTRTVPIPDIFLDVVAAICEGKSYADLLFPKVDGNYATDTAAEWWWESFSNECHRVAGATIYRNKINYETSPFGDEVTPHYIRHTYATDLHAAGVDKDTRRAFLGHADEDTTDTYTAMSEPAFVRAAEQINLYHISNKWCKNDVNKKSDKH